MCKSSAVVLRREIDVLFPGNEVIVLAIDSLKRLQVILLPLKNVMNLA